MKWYILVGVMMCSSPVNLFATSSDLEDRMDDFGIAESVPDDKIIVIREESQHTVLPVESIENSEDKQIVDDSNWRRVTLKGKYNGKLVSLKIPSHWILIKKSNEWEIKENKKKIIAFKVDKEFFKENQFDEMPPLIKDFQKSLIEINGQKILDVSLWMEHKKTKYYSQMYTLMDFKLKNKRKKLIFMLTTTDKQQSKKILNLIVQSLEIIQPDSKTEPKDSLIKHKGKILELHKMEAGEADDVLNLLKGTYGSTLEGKDTIYAMAKIDLDGDETEEIIVQVNQTYGSCGDNEGGCTIFLFQQDKNKKWGYMSMATHYAKEISVLPTATNGYYDLSLDNVLQTYENKRFGYRIGKKAGVLAPTKEALAKTTLKTVEDFGLSIQINSEWKGGSGQKEVKPFKNNWVFYKGMLEGSKEMVSLYFYMVQKADKYYEYEFSSQSGMVYRNSKIGSGFINGHAVNIYYYDGIYDGKKETKRGGVYLLFEEKMYFSIKENNKPLSRYVYIKLDGDLFFNLDDKDIQPILDKYITPFLNTVQVTKNSKFTTNTSTESTALQLKYEKNNVQSIDADAKIIKEKVSVKNSSLAENKYMRIKLHQAVLSGNLTRVKENLKDLNTVDSLGRTALHYASYKGYVGIARLLLSKGADIDVVDKVKQWTPLFFAVYMDQKSMIKLLVEKGANQTLKDKFGRTIDEYKKDK